MLRHLLQEELALRPYMSPSYETLIHTLRVMAFPCRSWSEPLLVNVS
jgi:hypothetical protein